jgi:hypothetical protein
MGITRLHAITPNHQGLIPTLHSGVSLLHHLILHPGVILQVEAILLQEAILRNRVEAILLQEVLHPDQAEAAPVQAVQEEVHPLEAVLRPVAAAVAVDLHQEEDVNFTWIQFHSIL